MSATPQPPQTPDAGRGNQQIPLGLGMVPGNAELIVYVLAILLVGLVVLVSDAVDAGTWATAIIVLTAAYLLSRGIAKASRVHEY